MTKSEIITAIKAKCITYSLWYIGVTDNPDERKAQHANEGSNVSLWQQWKTNSEQDGRDIEKYFLDLGMKGGQGGGGRAGYVYVF